MKHTFAVCAYKESPYIEECIRSLKAQSVPSEIILCTSTPNRFLRELSERYGIALYEGTHESSLKNDWNYAVETAVRETGAGLITIAHQDDRYHREYAKTLLETYGRFPDLSVFCTRYRTIDADGNEIYGKTEAIKRLLRLPLRCRSLCGLPFIKKMPLCFGNAVGCPTCCYNTKLTGLPLFLEDRSFVIDWETLWRLAGKPGRFVCVEKALLDYRVHDAAATKENIQNHNREKEEIMMFSKIWPKPVTAVLMHFYKKAYSAYGTDA